MPAPRQSGSMPFWLIAILSVLGLTASQSGAPQRSGAERGSSGPSATTSLAGKLAKTKAGHDADRRVLSPLLEFLNLEKIKELDSKHIRDHYEFESLISCINDPIDATHGFRFDLVLDTLQKAMGAEGFVLDRYYLPWKSYLHQTKVDRRAKAQPGSRVYETEPGLLVFRSKLPDEEAPTPKRRFQLIFLVGENPVSGIHKRAFLKSVELIRLLSGQEKRLTCPLGVLGPCSTGSADSLAVALSQAAIRYHGFLCGRPSFRVVSGSATSIKKAQFEKRAKTLAGVVDNHIVKFHATVVNSKLVKDQLIRHVVGNRRPFEGLPLRIGWLTEATTGYGQAAKETVDFHTNSDNPTYEINSFPFPLHISRVRGVYDTERSKNESQQPTVVPNRHRLKIPADPSESARDVPPQFSPQLSATTVELALSRIFAAINEDHIKYVGITATDPRDRIFLAGMIREHCPNVQLLFVGTDLLYAHPDYSYAMRGALVASTYPLFHENQHWTFPWRGDSNHVVLPSQVYYGMYNALIVLRNYEVLQSGRRKNAAKENPARNLLEYGTPFDTTEQIHRPSIWISAIGSSGLVPVRFVRLRDAAEQRAGDDCALCRELVDYTFAVSSEEFAGGENEHHSPFAFSVSISLRTISWILILLGCWVAYQASAGRKLWKGWLRRHPTSNASNTEFNNPPRCGNRVGGLLILFGLWVLLTGVAHVHLMEIRARGWGESVLVCSIFVLAFVISLLLVTLFLLRIASPVAGYLRGVGGIWRWILSRTRKPSRKQTKGDAAKKKANAPTADLGNRGIIASIVAIGFAFVVQMTILGWEFGISGRHQSVEFGSTIVDTVRMTRLFSGVSVFVPMLLFMAAFATLGFRRMKRSQIATELWVPEPWPDAKKLTDVTEPEAVKRHAGLLMRLKDSKDRLRGMLASPFQTLFKESTGLLVLGLAVCVSLSLLLWQRSVSAIDGEFMSTMFWLIVAVFLLFWGFELVETIFLAKNIRKLHRRMTWMPMQQAFSTLPDKIRRMVGRFWQFRRIKTSHLRIPVRCLEQLGRDFENIQSPQYRPDCALTAPDRLDPKWNDLAKTQGAEDVFLKNDTDVARYLGYDPDIVSEHLEAKFDDDDPTTKLHGKLANSARHIWTFLLYEWGRKHVDDAFPQPKQLKSETEPPGQKALHKWVRGAEQFLAMESVFFIHQFLSQLWYCAICLLVSTLLFLIAVASYPIQPQQLLVITGMTMMGIVSGLALVILVTLERNELLSRISGNEAGRIHFDFQFVGMVLFWVLPFLFAAIAGIFPEALSWLSSILGSVGRTVS